jgi:hypothetical protein
MNQHQFDTLSLVCILRVNASTRFGCYSTIFRRLCTHPTHAITPKSNCAEPPNDGRVTPETCRGIDLINKLRKLYLVAFDSLIYHDARSTKDQVGSK